MSRRHPPASERRNGQPRGSARFAPVWAELTPPSLANAPGRKTPESTRCWRRPIFPKGCPLSIFGAGELDFRVRDGNGYGLSASVTSILLLECDRLRPVARKTRARAPRSPDLDFNVLCGIRYPDFHQSPDPG